MVDAADIAATFSALLFAVFELMQIFGGPIVAYQVNKACRHADFAHCDLFVFHSLFFWVQLALGCITMLPVVMLDNRAESRLAKVASGITLTIVIAGVVLVAPILDIIYLNKLVRDVGHIYRPTGHQLFFMYLSGATLWICCMLMFLAECAQQRSRTQPDTSPLVLTESSPPQIPGAAVRVTPPRQPPVPESRLIGECPICYEVVGLHLMSPCGHPICRTCFKQLQAPAACPECRRRIDTLVTPYVTSASVLTNQ